MYVLKRAVQKKQKSDSGLTGARKIKRIEYQLMSSILCKEVNRVKNELEGEPEN